MHCGKTCSAARKVLIIVAAGDGPRRRLAQPLNGLGLAENGDRVRSWAQIMERPGADLGDNDECASGRWRQHRVLKRKMSIQYKLR